MMLEEFLKPRGISRKTFAAAVGLSYGQVNKILNCKGTVLAVPFDCEVLERLMSGL